MSRSLLPLAFLVAAAACASSDPGPLAPTQGRVLGTVTDISVGVPPAGGPGSQVYLLRTPDAHWRDAVRSAPVTAVGERTSTFAFDSVPPGRYYLEACLALGTGRGCVLYRPADDQPAAPIDVVGGGIAQVAVLF